MNEFITTEENLSCDHCEDSPNWSRRLFPFQIGFESLDRAQTKSLELKVRYGCNFFPGQFDGDEAWSIAANGKCFDAVSRIEAPFVVFETISPSNHPYHFIGSPYNILATGLPFDGAASFASDVFLQPGQKILLYFRSGWCVIASLSEEQSKKTCRYL